MPMWMGSWSEWMPDFCHLDAFDLKQYEDDACFDYGNGEGIRLSSSIEKEAGFH